MTWVEPDGETAAGFVLCLSKIEAADEQANEQAAGMCRTNKTKDNGVKFVRPSNATGKIWLSCVSSAPFTSRVQGTLLNSRVGGGNSWMMPDQLDDQPPTGRFFCI